jgi:hypothetical protein
VSSLHAAICAAAAALAALALAGDAGAQEAPDGVALFEQARFEEAQAWFRLVLVAPDANDAAVTRAHLYLAAIALAAGEQAAAEAHAAAAVTLDPAVTAPPGAPPELDSMLRLAASTLPRGGLSIELDGPECRERREPVRVRAALTTASPALAASVTVRCEAGDGPPAEVRSNGPTAELEIAPDVDGPGQAMTCLATARTAGGVPLRAAELRIPSCDDDHHPGRRRRMSPWGWVGVGGGAALVTVAIVLAVVLSRPDMADVGAPELVEP